MKKAAPPSKPTPVAAPKPGCPVPWPTRIMLATVVLASTIGGVNVIRELSTMMALRAQRPYAFSGETFAPIKPAITDERAVGFITDRDIEKDPAASLRLTQAQFTLAPTILDLNNPGHRFLILDFTDRKNAMAATLQLKAKPLKISPDGIIFAERQVP